MYDLAIIGAGWAGFNAALAARRSGLSTCVIESKEIGGTCLNRGCIPTKSLIHSAKIFSLVKKASLFGVEPGAAAINFRNMQERKARVVEQLRNGMQAMLKGVDLVAGSAEIISPDTLKVGDCFIRAKHIILAVGSQPVELRELEFSRERVISSDEALLLEELPQSILIIGGGVIGCEFAGLFNALGSRVSLVEKMPSLLPGEDNALAAKLETVFKKRGIKVFTAAAASDFREGDYSKILVCVGRTPSLKGLGLEKLGLKIEAKGIAVDGSLLTSIPNVYAAGDCTAKLMLAHYAAFQGELAVRNIISGNKAAMPDPAAVASCIFTDPEIASVGLSEEKAVECGRQFIVHKFDFLGSGMARIIDETEGFIKLLSERHSGELLGACIIGPKATELISVFTLAICAKIKVDALREVIFAHPTLSESIHESLR